MDKLPKQFFNMPLHSDHARDLSPLGGFHRSAFNGHLHQKEPSLRERDLSPVASVSQVISSTPLRRHDTSSFGELSSVRDAMHPEASIRDLVAKQDREVWRSSLRDCLRKGASSQKAPVVADQPQEEQLESYSSLREWSGIRAEQNAKEVDVFSRQAIRDIAEGDSPYIDRLRDELRTVVEAQERLLRVVDCMSSEVTQVKNSIQTQGTVSNLEGLGCDRALLETMVGTVTELQRRYEHEFNGASGLKAHIVQHEAMLADVRRSHADEALRQGGAISDLQLRIQGLAAAAAVAGGPQSSVSVLQQQLARQEAVINDMLRQNAEDRARLNELGKACNSPALAPVESTCNPEALQRVRTDVSELHRALIEDSQQIEQVRAELRRVSNEVVRHDVGLGDMSRLRTDVERHEATIAYLQRQDSQVRDVCDLAAQVQQLSERESEGQQSILKRCELHAESGNARLLEELSARQREEASGLRTELRTALQEHEINIKALGEHLWVIDEQLWQTDKRLGDRIEELSQMNGAIVINNGGQKASETQAGVDDSYVTVGTEGAFYAATLETRPGVCNESFGEELLGAVSASTENLHNIGIGSCDAAQSSSVRSTALFEGPVLRSVPSQIPTRLEVPNNAQIPSNSERLLSTEKWNSTRDTIAGDVAQAAVAAVAAVANNAVYIAEENLRQ